MLNGFSKIFSFTFIQHIRSKGYRTATVTVALLLLLLPILIMAAVELFAEDDPADAPPAGDPAWSTLITDVFVADESGTAPVDYALLNSAVPGWFDRLVYHSFSTTEEAAQAAAGRGTAVILSVTREEGGDFRLNVLLPAETLLTETDTDEYANFVSGAFGLLLMQKSGLEPLQLAELTTPVNINIIPAQTAADDPAEGEVSLEEEENETVRMILSYLLPYVNIMLLYFMVLAYGQGVANSVITEKTSKLMDTFLLSVKPTAMVFGKVLAIALSGMLQLFSWLVMVIAGFILGGQAVRLINPQSDMALLAFFDTLELFSGAFSLPGVIVGILILLAGFLLYCSLSAVGGSVAEKPEDLSNTNILFSMVLVISFFAVLYQGGLMDMLESGNATGAAWLNWIPFTAIMIAPSRLMLGDLSVLQGLGCLVIVLITSALIMMLAGRVYRLMALYKGNPPKLRQLLQMLKSSK